jgi:N-acetylglucosaminyl-diphospho-decaprenol L-rhamnosyltransferase
MKPEIGVVIVHYGRPDPTLRCARSVLSDPSSVIRHIVIVDNQGNLTREMLDGGTRLVTLPDNPGFGAGANAGVAALDASIAAYVVLNNDVQLQPGFLSAAVTAMEPGVGAVGGPITDQGPLPRLWYAGGGVSYLTGTVWQSRRSEDASRRREVGFIPGTAMALKPDAYHQVGGFDPSYFLYNEDIDICLRLLRRGWKLVFEPNMACIHYLGESTGSRQRSPLYLEHITRSRLRPFSPSLYRLDLPAHQPMSYGTAWDQ